MANMEDDMFSLEYAVSKISCTSDIYARLFICVLVDNMSMSLHLRYILVRKNREMNNNKKIKVFPLC